MEKNIFETQDTKAQTTDGFDNFISRVGLNNDNTLSAGLYTFNLVTRNRIQLEAAYRGSWIVGQVIDTVADDMTKNGINITTIEDDQHSLKDILSAMDRLSIWQSLSDLIKWGRLYGGAIAVLQIEGQDLSTPLNFETISQNQFKGLAVFDRWQLNPDLSRVIQTGHNIGLPEYYQIVTAQTASQPMSASAIGAIYVHHSRVIRFQGIKLPFFQAITEMMWGESVLERLWDRLISFDTVTLSTANLVERAHNRTIGIEGYREIIAAGGKAQQALEKQFEAMREFQTNEGMTILDKNDTFQTTNYTFSGLSDVILQFAQQLSGASQIPLVRLLGQSPAGLNSSGESDIRTYYDGIHAKQEAGLREGLNKILHVLWRSTFGVAAPKDLEFTFIPLWQMSANDQANTVKSNTETILGAFDRGVIDRATAMKELLNISGDLGIFSNITEEQILEAQEDLPPTAVIPEEGPASGIQELPANDPVPALDVLKTKLKKWLAR